MFSRTRLLSASLAALLSVVASAAHAQQAPHSYAILSLIGDSLSIHTVRQAVGLVPGANKIVVDYPSSALDQTALAVADRAIRAAAPDASPTLMMSQDIELYKAQNAMFDAPAANKGNRDYLLGLLREHKVSHLVLITKLRNNAALKLVNSSSAAGTLEGLGFFVDDTLEVRNTDTRETRNGIVAPFAYIQMRLLDAATLEVVGTVEATESSAVAKPSTTDDATGTWGAIGNADKLNYLRNLINVAVTDGMPALLSK